MRRFLVAVAALACAFAPLGVSAQTPDKVYRVGLLSGRGGPAAISVREGLSRELAQRGLVPNRNLVLEIRSADGKFDQLPRLAKELADSGVDVIVTVGYPSARAAKDATTAVPIVVTDAGNPVETGLAASFSRPGGNLTGLSDMASELSVKRLDLLKAAVPGLKLVAMLWNGDDIGMATRHRAAVAAAATLGIAVQSLGVREPDDFDVAFAAMTREKPDGIMMVTDALVSLNRKRVFEFAAAHRIAAIYEFDFLARDGGLMSYGPDRREAIARLAGLVDRILKGAKPAALPFEQPTRFRFVINRKTADASGMVIPHELLLRADEVIE